MPYRAFFVEDEIVTREGIRDNVDWKGSGFEFCGEAPDGEMALPLLQTTQPDLLITDIKMPFMDGLELCKMVRERMPWVKIVILSGHDEFEYAQKAINLGVTEYLLKPVTAQDLQRVLHRIAEQIDREQTRSRASRKVEEPGGRKSSSTARAVAAESGAGRGVVSRSDREGPPARVWIWWPAAIWCWSSALSCAARAGRA